MKLATKLLFLVSAVVIVLTLALHDGEPQSNVKANPLKANLQQYERVQKPNLVVNIKQQ
jgi:hypothetical protein